LQQTPWANAHWAQTRLHESRDLSFEVGGVSDPTGSQRDYETDLNERPHDMVNGIRVEKPQQDWIEKANWC
jgi:hypothetical protein